MGAIPTAAFLPEALVLASTLLVFLADVLGARRRRVFGTLSVVLWAAAFLSILGELGVPGLAVLNTLPGSLLNAPASGPIAFTSLGLVFQGLFLGVGLLVGISSLSDEEDDPGVAVFYALMGLALLGMMLVALSADLIFLLLSVEITSISTYVLVGYSRRESRALEAAMKFYIIGALSTAISFFGASLLYGAYGTTALAAFAFPPAGGMDNLALVGFGLLMVGLGFKLTLVPFHMWAVDVYDGAPSTISAFLSAGSKKMGLFAFFVVFIAVIHVFSAAQGWALSLALGGLAVITMTVGNLQALQQQTMKRLLAYSSISQAGYLLLGVAVGTPAALSGATLLAIAHVLMKGGAFVVVAAAAAVGVGAKIDDYRSLGRRLPLTAISFALLLLSLAGIPLTLGFVGKFYLFASAVQLGGGWFVFLAVAGLLNSAVSVFYYGRVLRIMYMSDGPSEGSTPRPLSASVRGVANAPSRGRLREEWALVGGARLTVIVGCAVLTVVLGVYPTPLVHFLNGAAQSFLRLGY